MSSAYIYVMFGLTSHGSRPRLVLFTHTRWVAFAVQPREAGVAAEQAIELERQAVRDE
jgi:hypothetical protein